MDSRSRTLLMRPRMSRRLFAIAQDRQAAGVRARQRVGGDRAGRCSTNGCNFACVDDANRRAGFGIEQNHQTLVRLDSQSEVLREDADQLRAEWRTRAHCTGHDSERRPSASGMIDRRSCLVSPRENAIIASRTIGMHIS